MSEPIQVASGWGSIYCSTWWGDYRNIQHSLGYKPDCIYPAPVVDFITRVELDGGTVEGKECLANALMALGWSESTVTLYITRVRADSGTVEALDCLEDNINNLKL